MSFPFRFVTLAYLILTLSCHTADERKARRHIKEKYKASEIRIHFPEEEFNDTARTIAELIIINSVLSREEKPDSASRDIARTYFNALRKKDRYYGMRVILANPDLGTGLSGFAKQYFFESSSLRDQ
jgi:hypothetical protein